MVKVNPDLGDWRIDPSHLEEMGLRARVSALINRSGGATILAKTTGIPRSTLEKYVAKTSTASLVNAAKIAASSGVTLDELLRLDFEASDAAADEAPEMVARPYGAVHQTLGRGIRHTVDESAPDLVPIPLYDEVRPSAGSGSLATSELPSMRIGFEPDWLSEIGVRPGSAVILPAQGDSMEPTITSGSPMLVDTSKTEIQSGFIYVIAVENDLLVKRIRRRVDGQIELISDNPAYKLEVLSNDKLRALRVIGRVHAAVIEF